MTRIHSRSLVPTVALLLIVVTPTAARAAWLDAAWHYRRPIQVGPVEGFDDHVLCQVEFYTDGHALPNGEDIRVATEDGKLVPSHVLMAGPGDRMRVVFEPRKDIHDYAVYFGNPTPTPPPEQTGELKYVGGMLLESRQWTGGTVNNFETIEKSWDRSKPMLGQIMIDRPFIGFNPFGDQEQWISKMTGNLLAPVDGDYTMAMAVDDEGGFYIDGKPTLFAHLGGGDIRYHTTVHLDKGWHDFVLYHVNFAQGAYVSVGWRRPAAAKVEVIAAQFFGSCVNVQPGPMEEHDKTLVADFISSHQGECPFNDDSYCFRYHFAAKAKAGITVKPHWDFGDGQTSSLPELDHVYLREGIYAVKLTAHAGSNEDVQTNRVVIGRDYAHIIDTHQDTAATESAIVAGYDLAAMPNDALPRLVQLHLKASHLEAAITVAKRMAAIPGQTDGSSFKVLLALEKELIDAGRADAAIAVWDRVPVDSGMQPDAARHAAELALWWTGDFEKAVKLLQPFQSKPDDGIHRMYGQALLLSGHAEEAQKILNGLANRMPAARKAALSGAAARSVEYFITEKDSDSGEEAWDRWMSKFPDDFLEGYSVVLRTKLMELRNCQPAAAKAAEAFATAEPKSSYAPQLLDRASKLLATSDPTKSAALHQLLKQKYPEDPLSQN